MPKVTFQYNIKKDAWSWVSVTRDKDKNIFGLNWREQIVHIPEDLLGKILKLDFSEANSITESYLKNHPKRKYRKLIIKQELIALGNAWGKIEKSFFNILSHITNKPIYRDDFKCFLTTGFMCPYNERENWFMVSMWHSLPFSITTICHELLHLQFLHYYRDYLEKKGLNDKQIEDIKESLTFLLNEPEFENIILSKDKGYPEHQRARQQLKKIWRENKTFSKFLDKAINEINKNRNPYNNMKK